MGAETKNGLGLFSRGTSRFQFAHSVDPVLKQGEADFDRN